MAYPPAIHHNDFTDPQEAADPRPPRRLPVLRTPFNRGVNNVVATPVIAIEELKVTSQRTGKSSKMSFDDDPGGAIRSDSKEKRFHFVPAHERLTVSWRIKGAAHVKRLRLEVYRRGKATPIYTKTRSFDQGACPKKGSFTFDGTFEQLAIQGDGYQDTHTRGDQGRFPDATLTAEYSPYKLKLVVVGRNGSIRTTPARWIYLDVLLAEITLSWGPKDVLAASPVLPSNGGAAIQRDHQVYDALTDQNDQDNLAGALPKPGQLKKVYLQAHAFYRAEGELVDNHAWSQFYALWGEGANIPIFATPALLRSDGKKVTGANAVRALGRLKFAWEWIDAAEDPAEALYEMVDHQYIPLSNFESGQTNARGFIRQAMDFDRDATSPPGRNCHVERGGKRGPAAPQVFPAQAPGGAFPFRVTNPAAGNWCAVSELATGGDHAGLTGVIFQPSIQAGDGFKIRVAALYDDVVDPGAAYDTFHAAMDDLPSELKAELGTFQVWKSVRHTVLSAMPNGLNATHLASVARRFAGHYIRVNNVTRSFDDYRAALAGIYNGTGASAGQLEAFVRLALAGANAHVNPARGVQFKTWDQWKTALIAHHGGVANAGAWASAYTHPTRSFWHVEFDMVPFAEAWPANFQFVNAAGGTAEVRVKLKVGHAGQAAEKKTLIIPSLAEVREAVTHAMAALFIDIRGMYRTNDPAITVTITADPGNQAAARLAVEEGIAAATDAACEDAYERAIAYAWGFRVMELAFNDFLGNEDGLITVQFEKPSNLDKGPSAKAYFASPNRASIFIFMLRNDDLAGTVCHEFGHAMYLNHQYYEQPVNDPRELHDGAAPTHCTMSTPSYQRNYCGFCGLRLRAWSIYELDPNRAPVPVVPAPVPVVPNMHVRTLVKTAAANSR